MLCYEKQKQMQLEVANKINDQPQVKRSRKNVQTLIPAVKYIFFPDKGKEAFIQRNLNAQIAGTGPKYKQNWIQNQIILLETYTEIQLDKKRYRCKLAI
mmetsp:Transcript_37810/g.88019  ORF Transcript_37810/g.88019 Transcript_37810/m.88019 type:complete len:99 (+) Transcript_37810:135-431(+)